MEHLSRVPFEHRLLQFSIWLLNKTGGNDKKGAGVDVSIGTDHSPHFTFLLHFGHFGVELDMWHEFKVLSVGLQIVHDIKVMGKLLHLYGNRVVGHLSHCRGRGTASGLHHRRSGGIVSVVPHTSNTIPLFNRNDRETFFEHVFTCH